MKERSVELKKIPALLGTLLLILSLFGAYPSSAQIKMGYLQNDLHQLAAFICLEKGLYKAEGLDVTVAGVFRAGPEEMSAFASGDLDFGYVGEAPAAVSVANKVASIKIIAQANLEGSAVVVRKDSDLKEVKDLAAKTAAVPGYATVQDFLFRRALISNGIAQNSVNTIVIKPPEMLSALNSKQIDAFIAWEPYPAKAVGSGTAAILTSSSTIWPLHPCCVLVVGTEFMTKSPKSVEGLVRAHVKATRLIFDDPAEALRIGVKFSGMDKETVRLAMSNIKYEYNPDTAGLHEYLKFLSERGHLKLSDPGLLVKSIIETKFLEEVLQNR